MMSMFFLLILVLCKDEEGNSFLIKDDNGWRVSRCMTCYCKNGLLSCRRTLTVNFPGSFVGFYDHNENCTQPQCNVAKFLREKKDVCEGNKTLLYLKHNIH